MAVKSSLVWLLAIYQLSSFMLAATQRDLEEGIASFSKSLLKYFNGLNDDQNFVVSPYAVQRLLLLVMEGANNKTYEEIQHAIHLEGLDETDYIDIFAKKPHEFNCNDFIYRMEKYKLRNPFRVLAKLLFDVSSSVVDFENPADAAEKISFDVSVGSNGLIKRIVKEKDILATAPLAYVNSALFGGDFKDPFTQNTIGEFNNRGDTKHRGVLHMMFAQKNMGYADLSEMHAQAISLPYANSDEKLLIIVPKMPTGLKNVVEKVLKMDFLLLLRRLKMTDVDLKLPRFSIDYKVDWSKVLPNLQAADLFSPQADLENTFERPVPQNMEPIVISKFHFDVSDYGSSTEKRSEEISSRQLRSPQASVQVINPFLFFIHNNDTIHFFGRFVDNNPIIDPDEPVTLPPETPTEDDEPY